MITANIATMKCREDVLLSAVASLIHQVDIIRIYGNDYLPEVPGAECYKGADYTDRSKFYFIQPGEIYLTCDDDLIYPPDYVDTIKNAMERYPESVITFHGRRLKGKGLSYYHGHEVFACLRDVWGDHLVDVPGTGVSAINTDKFMPDVIRYKHDRMADILLGMECAKAGKSIVCIGHRLGWILPLNGKNPIYDRERIAPFIQNKLTDEIYDILQQSKK